MIGTETKYQKHLELRLKRNQNLQTVCDHQYTTYPLRLSPIFRLENNNCAQCDRAYLYLINTSPGLLAGDRLDLALNLAADSSLYLTDQAATKVHPMIGSSLKPAPKGIAKATINYQIEVAAHACLELVPEPIILYQDSVLEQTTQVKLHPTAKLFISEIILPGRLARQEYYQFDYFLNRLQVRDWTGKLLFVEAMRLAGKSNQFKHSKMFTSLPIMGNAIAVLPDVDLQLLTTQLENLELADCKQIEFAISTLPNTNGILIRALGNKSSELKKYFTYALNCIRKITEQSPLPHIAK